MTRSMNNVTRRFADLDVEMKEAKENIEAASNNEEKLKNISAYDSITEVISHGIKNFQKLDEFFKSKLLDDPAYSRCSFCYPTALLNYAKTGPCNEAYKMRNEILKKTSNDRVSPAHDMLDYLNLNYPFVYKEKYCAICRGRVSYNKRSLNVLDLSRDFSVWTDYTTLQDALDRYFASKTKQCNVCKHSCTYYLLEAGPLLCINVEIFYECFYEKGGALNRMYCSEMVRTSLDKLPPRLTVQGCVYVLYGVIERISGEKDEEHRYVAYCRKTGNKWERRDGFGGERKKLKDDLVIDSVALIFYANIGYWDRNERKPLLEPAKSTWNRLTNIDLPELCLEKILSFLDNRQLKDLIDGAMEKTSEDDSICLPAEAEEDNVSLYSFDSRSSEYEEQHRRLYNVIIYNLPADGDISDIVLVKSLLEGIPNIDLDNLRVRRCRENPEKSQVPPVIVTFRSHFEAKNVLMHKKSFPKGIKVCRDFTKWQRNQYEKLMDMAEKHNKANPNIEKIVRYIHGIPTLINKKNNRKRNIKLFLISDE